MATGGEEAPPVPATEPLKYQTWVLKVSIHCQGCRRKVKKVLQSIVGVYTASVDLQQQKVTVTGNVDMETLIKKLEKAGRHAEPWPEKLKKEKEKGNKENNTLNGSKDIINESGKDPKGNGKSKEKDPDTGEGGGTMPAADTSTAKNADAPPKAVGNASVEKGPAPKGGGKESMKTAEEKDGGTSPLPQEKPPAGGGAEGEKVSGSGAGKKGKKGQKEGGGDSLEGTCVDATGGGVTSMMYPYFPAYQHPPPLYAVSYSRAYPTASHGTAYYAAAPISFPQQSHVYGPQQLQQQQQQQPQQSQEPCYAGYYYQPPAGVFIPPSDEEGSYDVFSDENANACRVM